ncbi:polysaccharide pyruvyl transferase family protein [Gracilibacillus phocaeensis]|uniref:polysaccharide pyruvyl transferase family protein n=1 Tax=Gracilibacillus phocaeensis TaxID=2042304 RepID=UPI00102FDB22|nr:polysaccharide pyruvyl transferase family protein [Gracilibacillus phocaeensis]
MISLHGAYENENFGDELLIAIQAKWLQNEGFEVALPFAVNVYREQINSSSDKGINALQNSEKLIYTGGGYFGEPNHKTIKWGINFFRKKHHIPAKIFNKKGKEYLICGIGAGPITNLFTRIKVVQICNTAKKTIVRDIESYNYLLKYGVKEEKLSIAADVVLSLRNDDLNEDVIKKVKKYINRDENKFYLGIHVGVSPNDSNYSTQINCIIESLAKIVNKKSVIPVLIADKRNSKVQEEALNKLVSLFKESPLIYRHKNIWETSALLSMLDAVITTKLHVGITAYTMGTKAFGIAAHQKTKRFYKQINKEEFFCELSEVDNTIEARIEKFIKDEYWDEDTLTIKEKLNQEALKCKEEILNFIN